MREVSQHSAFALHLHVPGVMRPIYGFLQYESENVFRDIQLGRSWAKIMKLGHFLSFIMAY